MENYGLKFDNVFSKALQSLAHMHGMQIPEKRKKKYFFLFMFFHLWKEKKKEKYRSIHKINKNGGVLAKPQNPEKIYTIKAGERLLSLLLLALCIVPFFFLPFYFFLFFLFFHFPWQTRLRIRVSRPPIPLPPFLCKIKRRGRKKN